MDWGGLKLLKQKRAPGNNTYAYMHYSSMFIATLSSAAGCPLLWGGVVWRSADHEVPLMRLTMQTSSSHDMETPVTWQVDKAGL